MGSTDRERMEETEEIKIPPMPEDFMPKKKTSGRQIEHHDIYHQLLRDAIRRRYWEEKWRIHYLKQLLKENVAE